MKIQLSQVKQSILINLFLGVILYLAFYVLDLFVYPEYTSALIKIRILLVAWLSFCSYLALKLPEQKFDLLAAAYLIPSAFGISLMCFIVGEGFASIYFVGNLLVIIGGAAFARINSFKFGLIMVVILFQHFLLQFLLPFTIKDLLTNIFFLGSGIVLSIFIQVSLNRYESMLLKIQDNLYIAATTDPLTNLFNRRKMIELIELENIRTIRSKKPYLIAIGDIDDFKHINDSYGHDDGDAVLIEVTKTMKDTLRAQDIIGRWGGEEFLILLPETDWDGGKLAIERLRKNIAGLSINMSCGLLKTTMTFGVAASNQAKDIDGVIKLADDALYEGKKGFKNCVIVNRRDNNSA
ncbi:MAG: diguanylate cyclase [Candidatus Omnitrophota bacterium]